MSLATFTAKRSLAIASGLIAAATFTAGAFMRTQWQYDAEAAVNWITGMVILVIPLSAGLAAYDVWRHARGVLRSGLARTLSVHRLLGTVWAAHAMAIVVAWVAVCAVGVAITLSNGSSASVDWTVVIHPAVLMVLAPMLGVSAALVLQRSWTPVAVALGVFLVVIVAENVGPYGRVLSALGFSAWNPYTALAPLLVVLKTIALVVAGSALVWLWVAWGTVGRRRRVLHGVAAASGMSAAVLVGIVGAIQPPGTNGIDQTMVAIDSLGCAGEETRFCTDENDRVASALRDTTLQAYGELAPFGVIPPESYVDERVMHAEDESRGLWAIDVNSIREEELRAGAAAATVARPAACSAYFADGSDEAILVASMIVQDWTYSLLTAEGDSAAAAAWADFYPETPWEAVVEEGPELHRALRECDASAAAAVLERLDLGEP